MALQPNVYKNPLGNCILFLLFLSLQIFSTLYIYIVNLCLYYLIPFLLLFLLQLVHLQNFEYLLLYSIYFHLIFVCTYELMYQFVLL